MNMDLPAQPDRIDLERKKLLECDIEKIAPMAGATILEKPGDGAYRLQIPFFSGACTISMPDGKIENPGGMPVSYMMGLILLHYLCHASPGSPGGNWADYGQLPDGMFYARTLAPNFRALGERFGSGSKAIQEFERICLYLGGEKATHGDSSFILRVFPKASALVIIYFGDEEFPPDSKVLVDEGITSFLNIDFVKGFIIEVVSTLIKLGRDPQFL